MTGHDTGLCKGCKKSTIDNTRTSSITKMAYRIAGGREAYQRLVRGSVEYRAARDLATTLYEAGQTFSRAQEYEERNRNGFVYVIDHPMMRGIKIGRACNPESRLRGYQTGCPRRSYRLRYALYFEDCHVAEQALHARLNAHQLEGEWFAIEPDQGQEAIAAYARTLPDQLEDYSHE